MTDRPVSAFLLSATLHGLVAGLLLLFSYAARQQMPDMPRVLELVAGAGDNFAARVAPALGRAGGVTVDIQVPPAAVVEAPPAPKAEPPAPKAAPPAPKITPAPTKAVPAPIVPNFAQKLKNQVKKAENKAKAEVARERKAEAKRLAEEQRRLAAEKKKLESQMTKEEFDRLNKAKTATTPKVAALKVKKIDVEGIAKGVAGGSSANKVGGAGGKALASDNDDVMAAYFALLKQRIKSAFEAPPGVSDSLTVIVQVRSNADGSLSGPRIAKSSGSREFDQAVLAALRNTIMPARPDRRSELIEFPFSLRERDDG